MTEARTFVRAGDPEMLAKFKMVLVVRKDINLSKGKLVAQTGHACTLLSLSTEKRQEMRQEIFNNWLTYGMRKIALKVPDLPALLALEERARNAGLPTVLVEDAGLTEIEPGTITCLGIGPGTIEEIDPITGDLQML